MFDLWTDLLDCLDLHRARGPDDADGVTPFDGVSQQLDYHRVFGGQLLGQFIQPASLACTGKSVKSLRAVFAREGRAAEPVRYRTTCQHEGRSFASLTITAQQPHALLASASAAATCPPRTARWSRPTRRRRCCAFATALNHPPDDPAMFAYRTSAKPREKRILSDRECEVAETDSSLTPAGPDDRVAAESERHRRCARGRAAIIGWAITSKETR